MTLVCGVDSSTQSTKVELREFDTGARVAAAKAHHPPTTPPRSEQDPEAWWDALQRALNDVGQHMSDVVAIAVAGQQHGLVVLDEQNRVIRPAKLWNDTESSPQAEALVAELGPESWAKACGSVPVAAFTVTKLAWLADNEPESYARVRRVMLPHDYLTWRLTGRHVTDRGDASGTGWWSDEGGYVSDLLDAAGVDRAWLPQVLGPLDRAGAYGSIVVGPGTGDNMGAALGLGLANADVAVSLGTSGTVYARSDQPTADPTGYVAGFADATGHFLPLVCTLNATKVTDVVARFLDVEYGELDEMAMQTPAGAGGVTLVPYLDGERTPNLPHASGSLVGLRSDTSREQVARAAYEGVACGLLDGLDALTAAGVDTSGQLRLVGGGAKSVAYRQIMADLAQRPVIVPDEDEIVAAGAALQAAAVLTGEWPQWDLGRGEVTEPDTSVDAAAVRAAYAEATSAWT